MKFKPIRMDKARLIGVRLSGDMYDKVLAYSKKNKITKGEVIRQMIEHWIFLDSKKESPK